MSRSLLWSHTIVSCSFFSKLQNALQHHFPIGSVEKFISLEFYKLIYILCGGSLQLPRIWRFAVINIYLKSNVKLVCKMLLLFQYYCTKIVGVQILIEKAQHVMWSEKNFNFKPYKHLNTFKTVNKTFWTITWKCMHNQKSYLAQHLG